MSRGPWNQHTKHFLWFVRGRSPSNVDKKGDRPYEKVSTGVPNDGAHGPKWIYCKVLFPEGNETQLKEGS